MWLWLVYSIGIVFIIMFLKSIILNPILFKEKWQAGLTYFVIAAICFFVFFMFMYSDYSSEQAFYDEQSDILTNSDWKSPQANGNVTQVNLGSSSNYIDIPATQDKNLQNGLMNLQKDLNLLLNNNANQNNTSVSK